MLEKMIQVRLLQALPHIFGKSLRQQHARSEVQGNLKVDKASSTIGAEQDVAELVHIKVIKNI